MGDAEEPEKKDVGLSLTISPAEMQAIRDWMRKHDYLSRGAAVRSLIRFALASDAPPTEEVDLRRKPK